MKSIKAVVKVYSHLKQKGNIAFITRDEDTIFISNLLSPAEQVDKAIRTGIFLLANNTATLLELGKKFPCKMFVSVEIEGETYSSETVLVKTKLLNVAKVVTKDLKGIALTQVINEVTRIHTVALKAAMAKISRYQVYLTENEDFKSTELALTVSPKGELVNA